jgi:hypothetical protein
MEKIETGNYHLYSPNSLSARQFNDIFVDRIILNLEIKVNVNNQAA